MRLIATMPVRNEEWCLGLTLRAALMWCDEVVCYMHACTDRSADIVSDVANESGRVTREWGSGSEWTEMVHRQMLLEAARAYGATHVAIVDADEILTGFPMVPIQPAGANGVESGIRYSIEGLPNNSILQLPGYNLRGGLDRYHSSGLWGNRWFSTAFRDDPRLSWTGDRFHHREPMGVSLSGFKPIAQHQGGVMHLLGASERRLRAKSALYKLTERLRWPDKPVAEIDTMYSWAIHGRPQCDDTPRTWQYRTVPQEWWAPYAHLMHHLDLDAEPWQEAESRRIVAEHPGIERGLDLFGVV